MGEEKTPDLQGCEAKATVVGPVQLSAVGKLALKAIILMSNEAQRGLQDLFSSEVAANGLDAAEWQLDPQKAVLVNRPKPTTPPTGAKPHLVNK